MDSASSYEFSGNQARENSKQIVGPVNNLSTHDQPITFIFNNGGYPALKASETEMLSFHHNGDESSTESVLSGDQMIRVKDVNAALFKFLRSEEHKSLGTKPEEIIERLQAELAAAELENKRIRKHYLVENMNTELTLKDQVRELDEALRKMGQELQKRDEEMFEHGIDHEQALQGKDEAIRRCKFESKEHCDQMREEWEEERKQLVKKADFPGSAYGSAMKYGVKRPAKTHGGLTGILESLEGYGSKA